jgi:hypothetical protein
MTPSFLGPVSVGGAGRPLLVGGQERSAGLGSGDWPGIGDFDPSGLPPELRTRLSNDWARDALFEHASVASFSRFSLHLMAVAAPPDLLHDAHRAAIDEVKHARMCFALASAYAGEPLGPGALPLEGDILGALDLTSIVLATVHEGCIGETLASLEAATVFENVQEPAVKDVLSHIAEDEGRHAELAWRFVKWALPRGGDDLRRAVRRAFDEAIAAAPPAMEEDEESKLLAHHGRLSSRGRLRCRREGLLEIVGPASQALLA